MLVEHKDLGVGPSVEAHVGARARILALFEVLFLNQLEQRLRLAVGAQQNPADGILSTSRELVGVNVEDLSAHVVAKQDDVGQLGDRVLAIDTTTLVTADLS